MEDRYCDDPNAVYITQVGSYDARTRKHRFIILFNCSDARATQQEFDTAASAKKFCSTNNLVIRSIHEE